jgi:release factor glutamine methyltransferase
VGAAIAAKLDRCELVAADIDPAAVACARRNLGRAGEVYEGDLFEALPESLAGRVDVLAVNAPYVPSDEIALLPPEARLYEAIASLDGGPDGLQVQRRVAANAAHWLSARGHLLFETSDRQAAASAEILRNAGFDAGVVHSDELEATVVIGGQRPQSSGGLA